MLVLVVYPALELAFIPSRKKISLLWAKFGPYTEHNVYDFYGRSLCNDARITASAQQIVRRREE